jgi:queuine tRNA-ribosyltransferase
LSTNPLIRNTTKAYLRHLIRCNELLGMQIASINNLSFYLQMVKEARKNIVENQFKSWKESYIKRVMQRL